MAACVFTIISKNYISYARVLMKSFSTYHPEIRRFVILADRVEGYFDSHDEDFEVIEAEELGIPDLSSFAFKYNVVEFNTAVKPFSFEYLFKRYSFDNVLYLDPDIMVFSPLDEVFEALESNSIVLTPHVTSPFPDDGRTPREIDILKVGIFNLGFMGLAHRESARKLLSWWKDRLYDKCLQAPLTGYAVDQGWISIVPCFFDDYCILRKPGYNVAYWNLHERSVSSNGHEFFVNGEPLYFFHFSGLYPDNLENISKYQNRFRLQDIAVLRDLFGSYQGLLLGNGYRESSEWPYYYGYSRKGSRISELARAIYWGLNTDSETFGNPFDAFWRPVCRVRILRSFFTWRMMRAITEKVAMMVWRLILKKRT